jgi:hypothetical protein
VIPVEEHAGLARDPHNKAVLNINKSEAERARERKRNKLHKQQEEQQLKDKVDNMSLELNQIKSLLTQLIEKTQNDI